MNWNPTDLYNFVYNLSHSAQGCSKAVSGPNVVVLAHKAAKRADAYFGDHTNPHENIANRYWMG